MKLRLEAVHEHLHLLVEDQVLQRHLGLALLEVAQHRVRVAHALEHVLVDGHVPHQLRELVEVLARDQLAVLGRLELADAGQELFLLLDVLHEEPVVDELQRHAVRLEAQQRVHVAERLAADAVALVVEVLDQSFLSSRRMVLLSCSFIFSKTSSMSLRC